MKTKSAEKMLLKVLNLDDSPQDIEIMRELLTDAGFELEMDCTDVEKEAVSFLRGGSYDIILSDFRMPGFDAFGALRLAMEICPNVPFICVSGSIGEELAMELIKTGAVDYVLKDRLARLPAAIKRALADAKEKEARKLAEDALRKSEADHQIILQTAIDGFWLVDNQGRLLEVNDTYCRMSGYSVQELLAMRIPDLENAEDAAAIAAHIQRIMTIGEDRFESRHRRKDGSSFDVAIRVQYQPTEGGRFVAFLQDITERKQAEEEIRASQSLLGSVLNSSRSGIMAFKSCRNAGDEIEDFEWKLVNSVAEQMVGRTQVGLVGRRLLVEMPGNRTEGLFDLYVKVVETGMPLNHEHFYEHEKVTMWFHTSAVKLGDGFVVTFADITERKWAEAQLLQQLNELRRWQEVTLGREDRNMQLKDEVNKLLLRLGEPIRYPSAVSEK